jgi:hypothetical protein
MKNALATKNFETSRPIDAVVGDLITHLMQITGDALGLALEPGAAFGIGGRRLGEDLDRDRAIQFGIAGTIHLP